MVPTGGLQKADYWRRVCQYAELLLSESLLTTWTVVVRPMTGANAHGVARGDLRGDRAPALRRERPELIVAITYGDVIFSIIVQGLTISRLHQSHGGEAAVELDDTTGGVSDGGCNAPSTCLASNHEQAVANGAR